MKKSFNYGQGKPANESRAHKIYKCIFFDITIEIRYMLYNEMRFNAENRHDAPRFVPYFKLYSIKHTLITLMSSAFPSGSLPWP